MDLKPGHYSKDGIEVVDVQGEIDIYTAPRLRELLIDLASKNSYQLVINLDKAGFLDSTGLGVLAGGLNRGAGARRLAGPGLHLQDFGTEMLCSLCATPGERNRQCTARAA